tara:strand:- start:46 stop:270 length:225 start_codon:yes stop_codon:yes gene_type:complete
MAQTNIIIKIVRFHHVKPLISIELDMDTYSDALSIADKLNDVAKAKGETTTSYSVETIEIPSLLNEADDDSIPF